MTPNDSIISEGESQKVEDNIETNFEFAFSNFPDVPSIEISRDTPIRYIAQRFGDDCQKQMIVGDRQTGKTNLLSQFVRQYSDRTISYFVTPNPLSQEIHTFLLSLSQQMSKLLEKQPPDHQITLENLKSLFTQLYQNLRERGRSRKIYYYIVIDGLEWSVKGKERERIIDLFPLQTFSHSPYLLCSCRSEEVTIIPQHAEYEVRDPKLWAFDDTQAEAYFKDVPVSPDKIKKINAKYGGSPGYLKIVKDTIRVEPDFDIESSPKDLDSLFNQQVETVFKTSTQIVRDALEFLAVSPVPLLAGMLSKLLGTEAKNLVKNLRRTGLIGYDPQQGRLEYLNELTKAIVKAGLDKRRSEIVQRLLEYIEANASDEDVLIDLLLRELDDYEGFQERLQIPAVIKTLSDSKTIISGIIKKYQTAFEMAQEHNDYGGLIKWSLGINAAKSFVSHAINQDEINALISIGEFEKALKRVYALPEETSKIRLLARTYTSMKERGEDIRKDAIEPLREMVKNLNIREIEKDLAQEIAIDLFPVLHDEAIALMEGVIGQVEKQSIVETAIEAVSASLQQQAEESLVSAIRDRMSVGDADHVISEWLRGLTYEKLGEEIKTVKNTRAKEYIMRQWCRQNQEDDNIVQAIYEWQNVIIHSDRTFVMPLRSLRHITELIIKLPVDERRGLIDALKVPEFTSIDSPKEEWVRVRLNLAKAQFEINSERAQEEIQETHENVLQTVIELDEKVFCFARLLLTVSQIMPHNASLIDTLEREFQEALDSLLKDSADHFELIRGVIHTLVERDPDIALIVATQLNTQFRQVKAVRLVLRATLRTYGEEDVSTLLKDALQFLEEFDETQRDNALLNMLQELGAKECVLAQPNLETLYEFSQKINAPTLKSVVLGNLATLYEKVSPDHAIKIVEQAIEAWRNENDLKARLSRG
ncbi:MAG: hypothetical protein GY799_08195, partial [Desulfobulbaceae bacterium]|nr:hypothetical protein [Desulfobulbaceae bacterium]